MSAIETLFEEVKMEADSRQDELIRRLAVNYPVGGAVCEFQAIDARIRKLKRTLAKADDYVAHLKARKDFLAGTMDKGGFLHHTEMVARRHRNYSEDEVKYLERVDALTEEVERFEVVARLCVRCGRCIACAPRTKLQGSKSWRTKRRR